MQQKSIAFVPRWVGPVQGFAINTARRYYPRLSPHHEFEDLLQEAYIVFLRCKRRYQGHVDNGAWFMALYRTALQNQFLRLISTAPRYNLIEDYAEDSIHEPIGEVENFGHFSRLLAELPKEILQQLSDAATSTDESLRRKAANAVRIWVATGGENGTGGFENPRPRRIRLQSSST